MPDFESRLAANLAAIRERIAAAAVRSGRDADSVRLIAVTKSVGLEVIRALTRLGARDLGENRVQQLMARAAELGGRHAPNPPPDAPTWHFIGHLQRNKVRQLLPAVRWVHAVESLRLAEELSARAVQHEISIDALLEVNVSGEASKYGVSRGELLSLAEAVARLPGLRLRGLMTMAPFEERPERTRGVFAGLREALSGLHAAGVVGEDCGELSMGMTNDFEVAIEEGATLVRIGSALFEGVS